jgi:hypothetical protein
LRFATFARKPTLLLRYGKGATVAVSAGALAAGDVLLLTLLHVPVLVVLLQLYVVAATAMLLRLHRASDSHEEQVAIGIGARMGNGLALTVLTWLALAARATPLQQRLLVVYTLGAVFAAGLQAGARAATRKVGDGRARQVRSRREGWFGSR